MTARPKIFVTRPLPAPVLELLAARCEVRLHAEIGRAHV